MGCIGSAMIFFTQIFIHSGAKSFDEYDLHPSRHFHLSKLYWLYIYALSHYLHLASLIRCINLFSNLADRFRTNLCSIKSEYYKQIIKKVSQNILHEWRLCFLDIHRAYIFKIEKMVRKLSCTCIKHINCPREVKWKFAWQPSFEYSRPSRSDESLRKKNLRQANSNTKVTPTSKCMQIVS